jgi:hypothetical protein
MLQPGLVFEGASPHRLEKVERIDTVNSATRSTSTVKFTPLRKHHPRQIITERILPGMALRLDLQRVAVTGVLLRRGPQADHLRRKLNQAIVGISGLVV